MLLIVGLVAIVMLWLLTGLSMARGIDGSTELAEALTVCPAGPPTCNYSTVQAAVDAASDGDVIKVAAGTYTDINNYGGLAQIVYIDKTVTIRGGYTTAFTDPPDPVANPTTLDAGGRGRVLYTTDGVNPAIEGLHLTRGDAAGLDGGPANVDVGGGVYLRGGTFANNWVLNNTADFGGGLYLGGGTLSANTIISNTSRYGGGGLYLADSDATLSGNTISSNTTDGNGGGLCLTGSDATLSGNTVSSNTAHDGGGVYVYCYNCQDETTLIGNSIISNTAQESGGGLYLEYSAATLSGNTIFSNTAALGGGLSLRRSTATVSGNTVSSNSADEGGGLRLYEGSAALVNNLVVDNRANNLGSGLSIWSSSPRLLHNTITRNGGGDGSGVLVNGFDSNVILTNTILVSHSVGIHVAGNGSAQLEGTLWGSGSWANDTDWGGDGTVITGTVNIWGDPAFMDPDAGDYHIGPSSAALDVGLDTGVTSDIDHQPRPYQTPDLGADEYWPPGAFKTIYLPLVLRNH